MKSCVVEVRNKIMRHSEDFRSDVLLWVGVVVLSYSEMRSKKVRAAKLTLFCR